MCAQKNMGDTIQQNMGTPTFTMWDMDTPTHGTWIVYFPT